MYNLTNEEFASVDYGQITSLVATYGLVVGLISLLSIVELWIIFKKCGKKGWLSIVPIANLWTLFKIVDLPGWLSLIPIANGVGLIVALIKLPNKKFGKGLGFGIGTLIFPVIFLGVLAFAKNKDGVVEEPKTPAMDVPGEIAVAREAPVAPTMPEMAMESPVIPEVPQVSETPVASAEVSAPVPDLMAAPTAEELAPVQEPVVSAPMEEAPALNLEETIVAPIVEAPAPVEPEVKEAEVVNAFEMPVPEPENAVINDNMMGNENPISLDTLTETRAMETPLNAAPVVEPEVTPAPVNDVAPETQESNVNIFDIPNEEAPNLNPLETPAPVTPVEENPNVPKIDADLEATFELPKMANEIINSDITETKTCPTCGHVNEYTNKVCAMCGSNLE